MPEGDTIHKLANFLGPRLAGERLLDTWLADAAAARRCIGRRVSDVGARGKHLFIELDDGVALRTHLGMYGSWHRYPPGADWQRPRNQRSVSLLTADWHYVCFNAREVELVRLPSVRRRIIRDRLGPDLIADTTDPARLVRRAREMLGADAPIVDALLDQRVACGIGNVYKSEVLYLERLAPAARLADLGDAQLGQCFVTAAQLLRRNLGGGRRVTRFAGDQAGKLWVYGRGGLPCLSCDTPIASRRMGRHHRGTYWCPACQADANSAGPARRSP